MSPDYGPAQGGLIATLRYDVPEGGEQAHRDALLRRFIRTCWTSRAWPACICSSPMLRRAVLSQPPSRRPAGVANAVPRWVLLLEAWGDEAEFTALAKQALSSAALDAVGGEGPYSLGLYRLQITRTKTAWSAG